MICEIIVHWLVIVQNNKKVVLHVQPVKLNHHEMSCRIQAYGIMVCPSVYGVVVNH
jgi:hypothetical protein